MVDVPIISKAEQVAWGRQTVGKRLIGQNWRPPRFCGIVCAKIASRRALRRAAFSIQTGCIQEKPEPQVREISECAISSISLKRQRLRNTRATNGKTNNTVTPASLFVTMLEWTECPNDLGDARASARR